jgi:LytS/YehU family sensor histidine kinase
LAIKPQTYLLFSIFALLEVLAAVLLFQAPLLPAGLTFLGLNSLIVLILHHWQCAPRLIANSPPKKDEAELYNSNGIFDSTLQIAHQTLPVLRSGLNTSSAKMTADIIMNIAEVPGIAITDREHVLTFLGVGCEYHQPGTKIKTEATKEVIATGKMKVVQTPYGLCCPSYHEGCNCPLKSAVIVPLKCREEVVGALKLYQVKEGAFSQHFVRLAVGLGELLSLQVELAELDHQRQLLTEAKLEALNAQINPHFFFNTLNTIISFSRTDPERSRKLLVRLAGLFRQTLNRHGNLTTLREELECVNTYVTLEKARFGDRFHYIQEVPPNLLDYRIPILSLQPLVENSINHGLLPKEGQGWIKLSARLVANELHLTVSDNGIGIPKDKIPLVLQPGYGSGNGVGLSNVNLRCQNLYGQDYGLLISSETGRDTTISMRIPLSQPITVYNEDPIKELLANEA